jgi:hypothetical protein
MMWAMDATTLTAGTTLSYTTNVPDFLANASWVLNYRLIPRVTGSAILLTGAADSVDPTLHRITASAATTAAWVAGIYSWASWVSKAAEVYDVGTGSVKILPDPRVTTAPFDTRTDAQIALEAAKAAMAAWTPTTKSYTIGDRSYTFNSPTEILAVINYWQNQVKREDDAIAMAAGLGSRRKVYVRLNRA